jgi:hypothetical protein
VLESRCRSLHFFPSGDLPPFVLHVIVWIACITISHRSLKEVRKASHSRINFSAVTTLQRSLRVLHREVVGSPTSQQIDCGWFCFCNWMGVVGVMQSELQVPDALLGWGHQCSTCIHGVEWVASLEPRKNVFSR